MSTFNDLITFTRSTTGTYLDSVVYGSESIINGDFSNGLTDWYTANTNSTNTITVSNGAVTMAGDGTVALKLNQENVFTVNKEYRLTVDATVNEGNVGGIKLQYSGSDSSIGIITASGKYSFTFKPDNAILEIFRQSSGQATNVTLDNISVKEVTGGQGKAGVPLLRTAAINAPRLEYDSQGNALGLLVEEARTNLMAHSDMEAQYWTGAGSVATVTNRTDNALGFFNGINIASNGATWHRASRYVTVTSGVDYVVTVFYKQGTSNNVRVDLRVDNNSTTISGTIGNLSVVSTAGGAAEVFSDEDYGGIRKVSVKWTPNASGTAQCGLGANSAVVGETVIGYGMQVEAGGFPTSYIPTEESTVTRSIESAIVTLSDFYYRQKHGTLVVEFTGKYNESIESYRRVVEIGTANTSVNRIGLNLKTTENRLGAEVYENNVTQFYRALTTSLPNGTGVYSKAALAWETDNANAALDGSLSGSADTNVSLTQTRDALGIMRPANTAYNGLSGHIKSVQYYPLRLSGERLEEVTA